MVKKRQIRVYTETSVFGGIVDEEFKNPSLNYFKKARQGLFEIVVSPLVRNELNKAPDEVKALFNNMMSIAELVYVSPEVTELQSAYQKAGVLSSKWKMDALHVALATVSSCSVIVSWNFKHIVNFKKIPLYNAVNLSMGYNQIAIHSPQEVIVDED